MVTRCHARSRDWCHRRLFVRSFGRTYVAKWSLNAGAACALLITIRVIYPAFAACPLWRPYRSTSGISVFVYSLSSVVTVCAGCSRDKKRGRRIKGTRLSLFTVKFRAKTRFECVQNILVFVGNNSFIHSFDSGSMTHKTQEHIYIHKTQKH